MPPNKVLAWLLLAASMPAAWAQSSSAPAAPSLRPTGPVTINADRAEWEKGGAMVYSGKVRLESGDLKLSGERLQLKQSSDGQFEARITGAPATLDHAGIKVAGSGSDAPEPVTATADSLVYDSRTELVEIAGEALLTRGKDEIKGQNIRYDVAHRRIQAEGGEGGQVRIVIQPPPRASDAAPAKPAVTAP